jgi:hypothetical protein
VELSLPTNQPEQGEGDDDGDHEAAAAGADLVDARVYFCMNSSSLSLMVTFLSERSSCAKVER